MFVDTSVAIALSASDSCGDRSTPRRQLPYSRFLDEEATVDVLGRLAETGTGTAGGAVHDALVAAAAAHHQVPLATRDTGALRTYRAFDVEMVIIR